MGGYGGSWYGGWPCGAHPQSSWEEVGEGAGVTSGSSPVVAWSAMSLASASVCSVLMIFSLASAWVGSTGVKARFVDLTFDASTGQTGGHLLEPTHRQTK